MITIFQNIPIYSSISFSELAEKKLISHIIDEDVFKSTWVKMRLAYYPCANDAEKDTLILDFMNYLWKVPSFNSHFSVFRDFDNIFTIMGKKGHFIHQFEVFLLGWYLISRLLPLDNNSIIFSKTNNKEQLFYAWLFASTAHDFGYPLQEAKSISKKLSVLYRKIHVNNIAEKYKKLSSSSNGDSEEALDHVALFDELQGKQVKININDFLFEALCESLGPAEKVSAHEIQEILKSADNHGYISAKILCKSYLFFLGRIKGITDSEKTWRSEVLKLSAAAISLHAIPIKHSRYFEKIRFNLNPIGYILFIIDNIQEWHRTLRPHEEWPSYNLLNFDLEGENDLLITYILSHKKWDEKMFKRVKDSLKEKEEILLSPKGPNPPLGFCIRLEFKCPEGYNLKDISLEI